MEPRIQSLINPILLGRKSNDEGLFQRALPSQRPTPVEPQYTIEELHTGPDSGLHGRISLYEPPKAAKTGDGLQPLRPRPNNPPGRRDGRLQEEEVKESVTSQTRSKHAVPIAEVLNQTENDGRARATRGGSLNDILLNSPRKRKRNEITFSPDASNAPKQINRNSQASGGSSLLTLPKPQTVKKKTSRRLPPLLQGLHQPPPDAGLFPRITEKEEHAETNVSAAVVEKQQNKSLPDPRSSEKEVEPTRSEPPSSQEKSKVTIDAPKDVAKKSSTGKLKRHKWSDEETADLLRGVAKFGIGCWKKILDCEDYKFSGRTAVDLKDRFRTCRPSDYCKPKAVSGQNGDAQPSSANPKENTVSSIPERPKKKPRSGTHRKGAEDLAKIGIGEPFEKKVARRERRPFSKKEDIDLLAGYEKYNSKWFLIKNDPTLCLSSRNPTDLRDRFRNRYPDKYKGALSSKAKSKEDTEMADNEEQDKADLEPPKARSDLLTTGKVDDSVSPSTAVPAARKVSTSKTPTSHPALHTLTTHFPEINLPSYNEDSGDDYSPVTLSRNILSWPDAQLPTLSSLHGPLSMTTTDQNPTLSQATTSSMSHGITMSMLMSNDPFSPTNPTNPPAFSTIHNSVPSNQSGNRTQHSHGLPSLSALTLPSAVNNRGPTLNLPPPSDILSGYEDGRLDPHNHSFLWGDGPLP